MPTAPIVLIGPADRTSQLKTCVTTDADVMEFVNTDTAKAVNAIIAERPSAVILEHEFATSALGSALIDRIRLDSRVGDTEMLMGSHDRDRVNLVPLPAEMIIPAPNLHRDETSPDDFRGTRRATRFVLTIGVMIHVDGDPATVVDMSRIGAQILFSRMVRPSQQVRVVVTAKSRSLRCEATVAWAHYELNGGKDGSYYRAGLEFVGADEDALDVFCGARRAPTTVGLSVSSDAVPRSYVSLKPDRVT